jgi:hypothetical protein
MYPGMEVVPITYRSAMQMALTHLGYGNDKAFPNVWAQTQLPAKGYRILAEWIFISNLRLPI